jgi:predicted acylesterase/phospholipase RssA
MPPDLTLTPALADIRILDFQRASESVEAGRAATLEVLQSPRRLAGTSGGATTPS